MKASFSRRIWSGVAPVAVLVVAILLTVTPHAAGKPAIGPAAEPLTSATINFQGYIKGIVPPYWYIGDQAVVVDGATGIVEKQGKAEVGAWVNVWATPNSAGALHADTISVLLPAQSSGPEWQFSGVVRNIKKAGSNCWWAFDDVSVLQTPTTVITGTPGIGWLVWVAAVEEDGQWRALTIEGVAGNPHDVPMDFEGVIEQVGETWRVAGQDFIPSRQVDFSGDPPEVGKSAEVRAMRNSLEELVGLKIRVFDPASEASVGAMVTGISYEPGGTQTWDVMIFSATPGEDPAPAKVRVTGSTAVDQSRAIAKPGQWVQIDGEKLGESELRADLIRLDAPLPVKIKGPIKGIEVRSGRSTWGSVEGQAVWLGNLPAAATKMLSVGEVSLTGVRLGNGVIWVNGAEPSDTQAR